MDCTMECNISTKEIQKNSYLSTFVKWLGSFKIEGAESMSKIK